MKFLRPLFWFFVILAIAFVIFIIVVTYIGIKEGA